jgi:uncharacterized DUF497 family protein
MRDDRFEWDDAKAASKLRKHGVSFNQACEAFDDPYFIEEVDDELHEDRWRLIGMTKTGLLFVVHTERSRRNRIISAREADRHEQDRYRRQTLSER